MMFIYHITGNETINVIITSIAAGIISGIVSGTSTVMVIGRKKQVFQIVSEREAGKDESPPKMRI